jgi:hemerythrin
MKDETINNSSVENIIKSYSRFVPHQFIQLMGKDSVADIILGDSLEKKMTILFSDMRDFTTLSESMTPRQNFSFINSYLERMEPVISRYNGVIDKYIGDAIMALFPTSANDALDCSIAMLNRLTEYNEERKRADYRPIGIGIGLNTGIMMLGTIGGKERMDSTVISDAVNLSSRIETMTKSYGVSLLISEHTYYSLDDASKYKIRFADRVRVKGKEQPQSVYEVFDGDPPEQRAAKQNTIRIFERAIAYYYFKEVTGALELFRQCINECPEDMLAQVYVERCERFLNTGIHEGTGEVDLSIEWSEDKEIGHPVIDDQHRQLFISANEFVDAIKKDRNFSQTGSMIGFLDEYVRIHFKTEENIMEINGYPFLDFQKDQHERFTRYFARLKQEIEEDTGSDWHFLLFRIQVLVMDWLVHHTCKYDKHFGRFLMRLQKDNDIRQESIL